MAKTGTVERALQGLGSTLVRAGNLVRGATVEFGKAHEPRQKLIIAAIACALALGIVSALLAGGEGALLEVVEKPTESARVRWFEDNASKDPDVLIINIDETALAYGDYDEAAGDAEGQRYAWPWPRYVYNKILRYCRAGGARVVVFDLAFSETGPNTNDPARWVEADGDLVGVETYDHAGDDLFVLEACANEDVVLVAHLWGGEKPQRGADELYRRRFTAPVEGTSAEVWRAGADERCADYGAMNLPYLGLMDGIPQFLNELRDPNFTDSERLEVIEGFKSDSLNVYPLFQERARYWSIIPVSPARDVQGVAGVGMVNVFADRDGEVRRFDVAVTHDGQAFRSAPLEAWRLWVLSWARDAAADESLRREFAGRFPGLEVEGETLVCEGRRYDLAGGLRDAPLEFEEGRLRYLGAEIPLDETGRMRLRYHNRLPRRELPAWARSPEKYEGRDPDEPVFAIYPQVSAKDILQDWDRLVVREELERRRAELETAGAELEEARRLLEQASDDAREERRLAVAEAEARNARAEKQVRLLEEMYTTSDNLVYGRPETLVKDKIVFVAGSAAALYDRHDTPLDPETPGTWILATALDNIKQRDFMRGQSAAGKWGLSWLAAAAAVLLVMYARRFRRALAANVAIAGLVLLAGWLAFLNQHWFHVTGPLAGLAVGFASGAVAKALTENRQRHKREAFARQYMGSELVDYVIRNPRALKLGGENRDATIYFSDVAGFTSLTEILGPENPERLVALLNIYLERMTDIMLDTGAVIDKYIGDAVMCFWGAPQDMQDHAVRACMGALRCRTEMTRMQPLFADTVREVAPQLIKPDGSVLFARAGLNSGKITVGNMGSSKRFAYTVMGDAVNLASRLEGQNKEYGSSIMIGAATEKLVRGEFTVRPLDLIVVKGKTEPTEVFELMGTKDVPQFILDLAKHFRRGVESFRAREFEAAMAEFERARISELNQEGLNPSKLYLERCRHFLENPPPTDWNGVFIKTSK